MDKDKQIEEMANITRVWCEIDNSCGSCHWETCNECLAECLYKAGYRRASYVAREIFEEIEKYLVTGTTLYGNGIYILGISTFAKLKKKYESEGGE